MTNTATITTTFSFARVVFGVAVGALFLTLAIIVLI